MPDSDLDSPAWAVPPAAYLKAREAPFARPATPLSRYLAMRDGCRIAIDVWPIGQGREDRRRRVDRQFQVAGETTLGIKAAMARAGGLQRPPIQHQRIEAQASARLAPRAGRITGRRFKQRRALLNDDGRAHCRDLLAERFKAAHRARQAEFKRVKR